MLRPSAFSAFKTLLFALLLTPLSGFETHQATNQDELFKLIGAGVNSIMPLGDEVIVAEGDYICGPCHTDNRMYYLASLYGIYGPVFVFIIIFIMIRRSLRGSSRRESLSNVLIFLLVMWYAPVLQMIGYMYDCFPDPERNNQHFLVSEPSVSCEHSYSRHLVIIHSGLLSLFIGLGFPTFIAFKIQQLKRENKLTASSSFASLFQYYIPAMAYFESFHMIRKALLIAAVIIPSAIIHSAVNFAINLVFLLVVMRTKPLIRFPSTTFKGYNLYLLSELSGATVTLLALIGAISDNQDVINILGATFATLNVSFAVAFFFAYHRDLRQAEKDRTSLLNSQSPIDSGRGASSLSRTPSVKKSLGSDIKEAEEEWDHVMVELHRTPTDKRPRVASEMNMPYMRSQVANFEENGGGDIKSLAIIDDENLEFCKGVRTQSGTKEKSANPLSPGVVQVEMSKKRASKKHIIMASRFR